MRNKREVSIHHIVQKLKHGYEVLFAINGIPPSQYHVLAGILGVGMGVVGLCMVLQDGKMNYLSIPWVSERRDSHEIAYHVAGLQNLGNNCFLNVILQALASCSSFLPFIRDILAVDIPWIEEMSERMPLTVALTSLLKELCVVQDERTVLNPRKVMLALSLYVSSFSLTRQQDAAEALIHLLSSLEEEISLSYVPQSSTLAAITAFPSRICVPSRGQTECKRWKKHFFGPFDGTIGSILTCSGCSSMLSMDFEHFCCLPLSPVLDRRADIVCPLRASFSWFC